MPTSIGRVTSRPRSRRSTSRSVTSVAFSVEPSTSASGCLTPSMPIPSATTQQDSAKCTPSIINATRSSPDRSCDKQLGQGGFGHRHEPARDRRLACRRRRFADLLTDRLEPDRVAARRQPGQHLLHRHLAQDLRRAEQLIGRNRQLPGAVGGAHPRTGAPAPVVRPGSPTRAHVRGAPPSAPGRACPSVRPTRSRRPPSTPPSPAGRRPRPAPAGPRACSRRSRPSPH